MADCRVYWGSHGCMHERGHSEPHRCDCCDCPEWHHDGIVAPVLADDDGSGVICVARPPYYGPDTTFYGEDA